VTDHIVASSKANTPAKPYPDFPLFAHQTGRWAKKVRGQLRFYGRWGHSVAGQIVPVDDVSGSAAEAKIEFDRCWPYHRLGKEPPVIQDGLTVRSLVNRFLKYKKTRLKSGELSAQCFDDYFRICVTLVKKLGKQTIVETLTPDDFEKLRKRFRKSVTSPVTLKNKINRARSVFKFAFDQRFIDRPVSFGKSFDRPPERQLRKARNEAGKNVYSRDEVLKILDALEGKPVAVGDKTEAVKLPSPNITKAWVLLGLNGGFGNTDVAQLRLSAINLETGWIDFARPKTEINRRIPLWPETVEALRKAIAERPKPASAENEDLCFLTSRGTQFVRVQPGKNNTKRFVVINGVLRKFGQVLSVLDVGQRKRIGFYTLRHNFETIGGGAKDQVALDFLMGHADQSMAAQYREGIDDQRLRDVVNYVRAWLWP